MSLHCILKTSSGQVPFRSSSNVGDADRFYGMNLEETRSLFGLQTYLQHYGKCDEGIPDLTADMSEFDDWI